MADERVARVMAHARHESVRSIFMRNDTLPTGKALDTAFWSLALQGVSEPVLGQLRAASEAQREVA